MTTGDIYHITGGLKGRNAISFPQGNHNDYVQVNAHAAARVTANDEVGTYTAWINLYNVTATSTVVGAGDDNLVEFLEMSINNGLLTASCTDGATAQFVTQADGDALEPHRWYHVAMVQSADSKGVKLFINGSLIASTNDTTTDVNEWYNNLDNTDTFRIGASNKVGDASVTNDFKGAISHVKYWSTDLTDDEVDRDFKNEAVQASSLQLSMDFVEDLVDAGLGADDGTIVGDALLINNYCEFTSRIINVPTGLLVADSLTMMADDGTGHAIVIEA